MIFRWILTTVAFTLLLTTQSAAAASANPVVHFKTDLGDIRVELFSKQAPATVENFLQYCRDGFYIGTIFHRVIPGFVVQGGGFTFDYTKKETRDPVVNESSDKLPNREGTIAMARLKDPDSATSQFYFNLRDNEHLDVKKDKPGYTVFGRVLDGMDVLHNIADEPQGKYRDEAPDLPIRILAASVE